MVLNILTVSASESPLSGEAFMYVLVWILGI